MVNDSSASNHSPMAKYRTFVLQTAIGRSADNIGLAIDHLQQNQDCPLTSHQPHRHHVDRDNFHPSRQNSTINSIVIQYQPSIQWLGWWRYQRRCFQHCLWYPHHPIEVQISWQSIPSPVKMDGIQWARYRAHWMPSIPLDLHLPGSGSTTEKRERPTTFRRNQTRWWFEIHQKSDPSEVWSFYETPQKDITADETAELDEVSQNHFQIHLQDLCRLNNTARSCIRVAGHSSEQCYWGGRDLASEFESDFVKLHQVPPFRLPWCCR